MLKEYKFNKWEYELEKAETYGYYILIFKNGKLVYKCSGFGSESMAFLRIRDYIIENEHNIELNYPNDY